MSGSGSGKDRSLVPSDGNGNDKAELTIPRDRLAGSEACLNCGTSLAGPFCHFCGQPDRRFLRFFPVLLRELLEDFLDLDSRFMRTLKPLMFRPGRLTRDYLDGRRYRYTPPMRLYLFSSIAFFLLAAMLSVGKIQFGMPADRGEVVRISTESEEEARRVEEALSQLPENIREQIELETDISRGGTRVGEPPPGAPPAASDEGGVATEEEVRETAEDAEAVDDRDWFAANDIRFNDKPWNRETNPVAIGWLPQWFNDWINDEIERSPEKAKQINENPNLIVREIFDILPVTMFVLLPVVALLFKFWYLFARRYYIEHLIFALHNHAFIFVALMVLLLLGLSGDWLSDHGQVLAAEAIGWLEVGTWIWIPLYLLISLRTVYRQNWFLTLGKYAVIGISYVTLLGFVATAVAIVSFLLV